MTDYVIDYSFSRPDPKAVAGAGYKGVLRYVCQVNNATKGKIITPAEARAIRAAGLDLTLNFEWYETRPTKGYQAGVDDAHVADSQADSIGYPGDSAIYYSVDFAASWPQIAAYFQGVHAASRRPVGVYGGLYVIGSAQDAGYAKYGWVTNAASWSGQSSWAAVQRRAQGPRYHLLQHLHSNTPLHIPGVADTAFDPNTVLQAEYGQWKAHETPKKSEYPEAMDTIWYNGEQHTFWLQPYPNGDKVAHHIMHSWDAGIEDMTATYVPTESLRVDRGIKANVHQKTLHLQLHAVTADGCHLHGDWDPVAGKWGFSVKGRPAGGPHIFERDTTDPIVAGPVDISEQLANAVADKLAARLKD